LSPRRHRRIGGAPLWRVFVLPAALLAGCVSTPTVTLDAPIPPQWRNAGLVEAAGDSADGSWWKAFGDERLDAVVDAALAGNFAIAEAVERVQAARLLDQHAVDPFLPNLRAHTDDAVDPDASASFFVAGFDSLWEFGFFGQRSSARRVARARLDSATAGVRAARVSLVAEVVRNWVELRSAQAQEAALLRVRDAQAERLRLLRIRQSVALESAQEIADADAELADAEASLAEPRRIANASLQRLAVLSGRSEPDPAWQLAGTQPALAQVALRSVPADLLRSRPEIAIAEAEVLRAAGELGLSRAQMYPFIGLRSGIQWSTKITSDRPSPSRAVSSIGPVIDIPLFDWGMRVANAHAHDHDLQAAVLAYRQSVLEGVAEVEVALGDLEQLRARVEALAQARASAQRTLAITGKRVQLGLDSPLDLHQQSIATEQRALRLVEARARHDLAFVALNKALGGSWPATDGGPH
jgi:NodT family efflux transporter outer membrane factor (OMF) lipoprotein